MQFNQQTTDIIRLVITVVNARYRYNFRPLRTYVRKSFKITSERDRFPTTNMYIYRIKAKYAGKIVFGKTRLEGFTGIPEDNELKGSLTALSGVCVNARTFIPRL